MKKTINKIVFGSFLSLALVACVSEFEYTPAPQEDAKNYVRVDETAPRNLDIDGSDIQVPFVRTDASAAQDITVELADTSGIFTLKNPTVSFAAGETTAYAAVSYSYDALDPAAQYSISVTITSGDVSEYTAVTFPVTCKKAWQKLGTAQWYDGWWIGGPYEKELIKAPDGTETYRLLDPWDEASVTAGGLTFVENVPYLEFVIKEDGSISWGQLLDMGFTFSGMTCHMIDGAAIGDDATSAQNGMVMENVAQFAWYPILNFSGGSFSWWGQPGYAYISFPGGPDLAELLGL